MAITSRVSILPAFPLVTIPLSMLRRRPELARVLLGRVVPAIFSRPGTAATPTAPALRPSTASTPDVIVRVRAGPIPIVTVLPPRRVVPAAAIPLATPVATVVARRGRRWRAERLLSVVLFPSRRAVVPLPVPPAIPLAVRHRGGSVPVGLPLLATSVERVSMVAVIDGDRRGPFLSPLRRRHAGKRDAGDAKKITSKANNPAETTTTTTTATEQQSNKRKRKKITRKTKTKNANHVRFWSRTRMSGWG